MNGNEDRAAGALRVPGSGTRPLTEPSVIHLLGGLRLRLADRVVTRFRTQKTGALLAYLAYHIRQRHSREGIVEMLWPESGLESGRHSLSTALSSLRSLMEPLGVPAGSVVLADQFSVALNPDAVATDVGGFEDALGVAARARNATDQAALLLQALERYTGALLPEYYQDWIVPAQERLALRFRQASLQAVELLERAGDTESALEVVRRTLSLDPQSDAADSPLRQAALRLEAALSGRPARARWSPLPPADAPSALPPSLPTGTATVLMTDIEGSTALRAKIGDAFDDALARHHALLRGEFRRNGGQEVKELGDAFLVVFHSVGDALACAIACQRALAKHPWPEPIDVLRVRMALHTGDVEWEDGEPRGSMRHHVARMLSAAHGGQILCSEATAGLMKRGLEPQAELEDLGVWQLRNVEGPERLFQATYPDQEPTEFPPLNATPSNRAHLPLQFTRFFGRETEIGEIVARLSAPATRLLSLTGPGGTGKTRLSIEGAARYAETFDGGVWFVPLADLTDPSLVPQTVLVAMGVPMAGDREPLAQLLSELRSRPTLLVLDNFEQLVAGGAEIVQALLQGAEGWKCLVTTRQTLGLPGEVELAVAPLPTPNGAETPERLGLFESVRLFVDRAQAARPDFRITNDNAPALAELCDRLEGIPLAIELAAARALVLSPSQMLAQLGDRFAFLVSRQRGVAERQRTLRAAVDWSYRLLAPDLRRFFARLSVFRGGWSLEAAEAVCEEPMALDMLAQLRECSLVSTVESDGGIRFRMLETLREFAEGQNTWEELAGARSRHAAYFAALAETGVHHRLQLGSSLWLDRLEAEHENLRAVLDAPIENPQDVGSRLRLANTLASFWEVRGYAAEGRRRLESLLSLADDSADDGVLAWAHLRAGYLCGSQSDIAGAERRYEEAMRLAERRGDRLCALKCICSKAHTARARADVETAFALAKEALALAETLDADVERGSIRILLGQLHYVSGDADQGESYLKAALEYGRSRGDAHCIADAAGILGGIYADSGEFGLALELYEESFRYRKAMGYVLGIGFCHGNFAYLALKQGDYPTACKHYLEALQIFRDQRNIFNARHAFYRLATTVLGMDQPVVAATLWGVVDRWEEELGRSNRPALQERMLREIAPIRVALGDGAFDRAWKAGRAMTIEQAVDYALAQAGS